MPIRMKESDRIRGTKRVIILIGNVRHFGVITCHYCHNPVVDHFPHVDHVIARANDGDAKDVNNCVVSCQRCNGRKCATDIREIFGDDKHNEIMEYLDSRLFSANDLVKAREINRMFSKTADVLQAVVEYGAKQNESHSLQSQNK